MRCLHSLFLFDGNFVLRKCRSASAPNSEHLDRQRFEIRERKTGGRRNEPILTAFAKQNKTTRNAVIFPSLRNADVFRAQTQIRPCSTIQTIFDSIASRWYLQSISELKQSN